MEGRSSASANNWLAINNKTGYDSAEMRSATLLEPSPAYTRLANATIDDYDLYKTSAESAQVAYEQVLAKAGTRHRDAIEQRLVDDVRVGMPRYKGPSAHKQGIIDTPADCEGWPVYVAATPGADNDHDGMADDWERANGFDPANPDDRNVAASAEGYTALEIYLNSLMGENISIEKKK